MNTSHPRPSRFPTPRSAETGATLIVGLILLLVLTVLGVSGMNTATMEIAMAANTQFQEDAFQLAEDGIEIAIGTRAYATDAPRTVDWLQAGAAPDRRAVTTYRMNTPAPGSSVESATSPHTRSSRSCSQGAAWGCLRWSALQRYGLLPPVSGCWRVSAWSALDPNPDQRANRRTAAGARYPPATKNHPYFKRITTISRVGVDSRPC